MTIAFRSIGTVGTGTTSVAPGLPASLATGDGVLIFVETKPDTATPQTPASWTLVADVAGGGGTTGASVGPTRQTVYFREKTAAWSTMPTITVTNGNSTAAAAVAYSKSATATWGTAAATGTYGSAAATTNGAATLGSNPGLTAGDWCVVGYSSMVDTPTWSGQGVSATGVSAFGTVQERSEAIETNTGNDVGGMVFDRPVTTGTATAAPTINATASIATRGTVALVRLREVAAPGAGTAVGTFAYVGTAVGATGVVYGDAFTRADQALGATGAWVPTNPTASELQIASSQLAAGTTPAAAAARWATAVVGGQRSRVQVVLSTVANFGPAVAMSAFAANTGYGAAGTWYLLRRVGANLEIAEKNSGASTYTVRATVAATVAVGDYLELTYDGTTLTGYLNDVQTISHSPVAPITGQDYVGVALSTTPAALAPLGDNWTGGSVATAAAPPGAGTATGTFAYAGVAAGRKVPAGAASGTFAFVGAASGKRTPTATGSGTFSFAGTASGKRTPKAGASGAFSFNGTSAGKRPARGAASGTFAFAGSATGATAQRGTAAGAFTFAGAAVGKRAPRATATGAFVFLGTAAGTTVRRASAVGAWSFSGAAVGTRPTLGIPAGTASGAWAYVGGAAGARASRALAAGSFAFAGAATGATTRRGSATGSWSYAGAASGRTTRKGSATGTVAYSGTATGARASRGTAAGTLAYTSHAVGSAPVPGQKSGAGTGSWSYTGTAIGTTAKRGAATGTFDYSGTAAGARPTLAPKTGAASGTVAYAGAATGRRAAKAAAAGSVLYTGVASGLRTSRGLGVGSWSFAGMAVGFTDGPPPPNPEHTLYVAAEPRTYVVAVEDTTLYVAAERGLVVAAEDPTYYVAEARALVLT